MSKLREIIGHFNETNIDEVSTGMAKYVNAQPLCDIISEDVFGIMMSYVDSKTVSEKIGVIETFRKLCSSDNVGIRPLLLKNAHRILCKTCDKSK